MAGRDLSVNYNQKKNMQQQMCNESTFGGGYDFTYNSNTFSNKAVARNINNTASNS